MSPVKRNFVSYILCLFSYTLCVVSCSNIDLYEKTVAIPGHSWKSSFKPSFTFRIKDTTSAYQLFLTLRHNDKYNYNNIWLNISVQPPGTNAAKTFQASKPLGTNDNGWLGTGMDDIYDHRNLLLQEMAENGVSLRRAGDYTFTIEQIMREDPLNNVMNVGLRLEKK